MISKKSTDRSVDYAKRSLEISLKYYLDFLNNPNSQNTSAMCLAANLSGEAISISKTTAPHAVSYPFTAMYNISHGHAVSLTLNEFLMFNYKKMSVATCSFNLKNRFNIIFELSKSSNIEKFNQYLKNLKKSAKLESNFSNLGINIQNDYSKIISGVNLLRLSNNPIELNEDDIKEILLSK